MSILRRLSLIALWAFAVVGIACGAVWVATSMGIIKPLVVISGSMEPEIMTGDLIVDVKVSADSLVVGDVISVPSELTNELVTHRIEAIVPDGSSGYTVTLKGDNNAFSDVLDYSVSGDVWKPSLQLAGWGTAIMRMTTPEVALPLIVGLLGLLGLAAGAPGTISTHRKAVAA